MAIGACVAGAALGAAFQSLFEEVKEVAKKGVMFKKKLRKLEKKLETMKPLMEEFTTLNVELDMSRNNTDFVKVMEEGTSLVTKLSRDAARNQWWKFPWNTARLSSLEDSIADLMQVLQMQHAVVAMKTLKLVTVTAAAAAAQPGQLVAAGGAGGCCEAPAPLRFDVGLDLPLTELRAKVFNEDQLVIVLTAPPGCGKTTLVQKLCKDDKIKERFKSNILFVKVSKSPNLSVIVEEIFQHYRREVPSFQDEEDACNSLESLLREMRKSSPILLVLDNVWSESESFVNKFCFDLIPGYKIVVTSRSVLPRFKPAYELKMLSEEDSMTLFRYHAKLDDTSNISKALVKEVVQHCKRHPLALQFIGSALRGLSPKIWRRELDKWTQRVSSVLDSEEDLLLRLQSSIEVLGEKDAILKECFIDLGLFPEDRRIPASALIDIWTELYGIKEDDAVINLLRLHDMKMANVVGTRSEVDEDDDYYSEHFATLHDKIRELAIHQSRQDSGQANRSILEFLGNSPSSSSNPLNTQSLNARLLSISTNGLLSAEHFDEQLTETEVLVLNFLKDNQALPEFAQKMSQLKVLIATNYGSFPAELRNLQVLRFLTSLKKIRLERVSVPSFASIELENLQKLSFFTCNVGHAFSSLNTSETFPNLEELNIDYCGDLVKLPDGICDLIKMKTLSVTHCNKLSSLPKEIGKMRSLKVLRLRSCTNLTELPGSVCELYGLNFLDISECFSIQALPEEIGKLRGLRKLNMRECLRVKDLPSSVLDFENLEEVVCDEEIKELWELYLLYDAKMSSNPLQSPLPMSDIMRDIILWRHKKQSLVVLLVSTAIWVLFEVYQFNFLTVLSWLAMFIFISLFLWANQLRLFGKEPPELSSLEITEESAMRFGMTLHAWCEEVIKWMFKVGAQNDVFSFALTVGGLWLLAQVGHYYFDLLSLLYIGIVMGMIVPPICVRHEENIRRVRERAKIQMKRYVEMFDERVIKKMKSKVGTTATPTPSLLLLLPTPTTTGG